VLTGELARSWAGVLTRDYNEYEKVKMNTIDEIKAAMTELEHAGIIEQTGEMRWSERSRTLEPVYALSELDARCPTPGSVSRNIKKAQVDS
jgi:hypothetical protein